MDLLVIGPTINSIQPQEMNQSRNCPNLSAKKISQPFHNLSGKFIFGQGAQKGLSPLEQLRE